MLNVLRIARMTADSALEDRAARMAEAFSPAISENPVSFSMHLNALDFMLGPSFEIVIAGKRNSPETARFLDVLAGEYLPNKVVIVKDAENEREISKIAPWTEGHVAAAGGAAAYVCAGFECRLPTDDPARMLELVREIVESAKSS